jgi:hypothetical protein
MFVRNSSGELVRIDEEKTLNERQLYNMIWGIKFNKRTSPSTTISVEQMKNYLNSKCFSL